MTNKILPLACAAMIACAAMPLGSCDSAAKREKASADSLVNVAQQMIDSKDYVGAFAVMDTLDKRYPQQLEARRAVTRMRSEAMTDYTQILINSNDSLMTALDAEINVLVNKFKHIQGTDISGYYVVGEARPANFLNSTAIEARVDDEDYSFYLVAINNGKHIGINRLALSTPTSERGTSVIPADNDRSGDTRADGIDMASFIATEVSDLIEWLQDNAQNVNKATLFGKNGGSVSVPLTPVQVQAILDVWRLSDLSQRLLHARLLAAKLDRQLVISRDHTVNLPSDQE